MSEEKEEMEREIIKLREERDAAVAERDSVKKKLETLFFVNQTLSDVGEEEIVCCYLPNPKVTVKPSITTISNSAAVFFDTVMISGIYKLTITFVPYVVLVVCKCEDVNMCMENVFKKGISSCVWQFSDSLGYCGAVYNPQKYFDFHCKARDNSVISAEINMDAHTLHFFVDGNLFCNYATSVPSPAQFGISTFKGGDWVGFIRAVSFVKLTRPSVDPSMPCKAFKW